MTLGLHFWARRARLPVLHNTTFYFVALCRIAGNRVGALRAPTPLRTACCFPAARPLAPTSTPPPSLFPTPSDCCLTDAGADALSAALFYNTSLSLRWARLTHLNPTPPLPPSDCCLTDAGADALAAALFFNDSLVTLDLEGNTIGDAGAASLAAMLKNNQFLVQLDVRGTSALITL